MAPDEKLTKGKVRYRPSPSQSRQRCGNCSMFTLRAPSMGVGSCSLVHGEIDTGYLCDRWEPKR